MDLQLERKGLDFPRKKKKWLILFAAFGFSGYGLYKVYHLPSVTSKRKRLVKLMGTLTSMVEVVSDSADTIGLVSKDLKQFLQSDSDEIPNSLKQLSKIARSEHFLASLIKVSEAVTKGILLGSQPETRNEIEEGKNSNFSDRLMDKVMSPAGTGFVSVVVGSFARNLVLGFYSNGLSHDILNGKSHSGDFLEGSNSSTVPKWVNIMCTDKCKVLIADCIQTFVSSAVTVYLDRTMDINFYDEVFSGLTNPKHQTKVRDILVTIFNGAVETLVKTSHEVLTTSKSDSGPSSNSPYTIVDDSEVTTTARKKPSEHEGSSRKLKENGRAMDFQSSGWVSSVSSTLAVPSNRRFVLDVTGRVTFETIRSLVDFFMWKLSDGLKRSLSVVHDEVIDRGFEVVRYIGAKSSVILTICFAFFLHILGSTQGLLVPA